MFIKTKIALCAALIFSIPVAGSAATKDHKNPLRRGGAPAHITVERRPAAINSDDPALTGGGSLGYNQNIYNW